MLKLTSLVVYIFMIPWGLVQFIAWQEWDWFILAVSGFIVWYYMIKGDSK